MTLIHRFVDTTTGEVLEKNFTKSELDEVKANQARIDLERAEAEAKATARQAILDRLGLTAEEAALILG